MRGQVGKSLEEVLEIEGEEKGPAEVVIVKVVYELT